MRLLGKEHYSFSLWCWLLQENLYIQGCKNSVLLPAFFFLKPKGPGEIICLWNFHFLHACAPRSITCSVPGSPIQAHRASLFTNLWKPKKTGKPSSLRLVSRWPRGSTDDSQMLFGSSVLPSIVHGFTGEPPVRVCQELCMRCGPNTLHMQVSSHITMECHQANGKSCVQSVYTSRGSSETRSTVGYGWENEEAYRRRCTWARHGVWRGWTNFVNLDLTSWCLHFPLP